MNERFRNALVGLFVIATIIVLGTLMVWFGEAPQWLGQGDWKLTITGVKEIRGVGEGSAVYLNGVEIGRVSGLDFKDPQRPDLGVLIFANIKARYNIPKDSVARIYGAVFGFGQGKINIVAEPGARALLDREQAKIVGEMAQPFGEILDPSFTEALQRAVEQLGELASRAVPVADNLSRLMEPRPVAQVDAPEAAQKGTLANLSTVVERFDRLLANANQIIGDEQAQRELRGIVSDLKLTSENLNRLVASWIEETQRLANNLNRGIDETESNIAHTLRELNGVLGKLDTTADSLASIMRGIEEGRGTAGLLARDERLYEAAVLTLRRFGELAATVQRIADKIEKDGYFTVGQKVGGVTFTKDFPVKPEAK